jgi:hypothetical protein
MKVCKDIKKFPVKFDQCNTEVIKFNCYNLMTANDRTQDS